MDKEEIQKLDEETLSTWLAHDVEGVLGRFADDAVWNDVGLPELLRGKDSIEPTCRAGSRRSLTSR